MEKNKTVQQWLDKLDKKVVKNIEEKLSLVKLGTKPKLHGQNVFPKIEKVGRGSFTGTTTTVIEPKRYADVVTIHNNNNNMVQKFQRFDVLEDYATEFSEAAARKMEAITQKMITDYLNTNATKWKQMVVTGGTATAANKDAFTSDNTSTTRITMDNLATAGSLLRERSVTGFGSAGGSYIGLIHPACALTLETTRSANSINLFDAQVNTEQGMMDLKAGAIGTKYGITFYKYPYAQTLTSGGKGAPKIYPTFILGEDAFFRLNWDVKLIVTDADISNPNGIFSKLGIELTYNCGLRDANRIAVILSQK